MVEDAVESPVKASVELMLMPAPQLAQSNIVCEVCHEVDEFASLQDELLRSLDEILDLLRGLGVVAVNRIVSVSHFGIPFLSC